MVTTKRPQAGACSRLVKRVVAAVLLSSLVVLMTARPADAESSLHGSRTTTTTSMPTAPPVETPLTFLWKGLKFSDVVLVAAPRAPLPQFFLRLSSNSEPIKCTAAAQAPSRTYDGKVNSFEVVCYATAVPSLFTPTLEVLAPHGPSTFEPITLINETHGWIYTLLPFLVGIVGALAILAFVWNRSKVSPREASQQKNGRVKTSPLSRHVSADLQAWNASDCWATNITAVGALLTGVAAAASGSLSGWLPGLPAARIEVLSAVFLAMLALAPLLYGVLKTWTTPAHEAGKAPSKREVGIVGEVFVEGFVIEAISEGESSAAPDNADPPLKSMAGTVGGVLLASFVTLVAVFGELTTAFTMVGLSTADMIHQVPLIAGLVIAAVVVAWYSVQSVKLLIDDGTRKQATGSLLSPPGKTAAML